MDSVAAAVARNAPRSSTRAARSNCIEVYWHTVGPADSSMIVRAVLLAQTLDSLAKLSFSESRTVGVQLLKWPAVQKQPHRTAFRSSVSSSGSNSVSKFVFIRMKCGSSASSTQVLQSKTERIGRISPNFESGTESSGLVAARVADQNNYNYSKIKF